MIGEKLVKKAIKGNDEAFLEIMNEYKVDLYKTALAFLKNDNEALEAIQEVTFRAYKNIRTLRNAHFFKTWLFRIMINYCNDQLKMKKRHVVDDEIIQTLAVSEKFDELEMKDAMLKLDERSRELLTLKYFNDMKIKEIAEAMQCPEGTVKTWLHKALKRLRDILEEKGAGSSV
ncbi:sigma-70 family RNA polymerase sigma factor [Bacillus sp. FJAT-49732]|uniref:Sigma-70 family RNA polymerase sigma factor n=1 Tax=Lederbergia citrisecunda TaxID=2833583 RepID=A0A942TLZ3_9BACI|nr:sigma-70 family RNA polymerase sigma factor [Lederbergia citrisecunda]